MMQILTNFKFWSVIVSGISLCVSIGVLIIGKAVAHKIMNNDLKHLTADVDELKLNDKEYRVDLKRDLEKIFRRIGKMEKSIVRRDAICDERHKI